MANVWPFYCILLYLFISYPILSIIMLLPLRSASCIYMLVIERTCSAARISTSSSISLLSEHFVFDVLVSDCPLSCPYFYLLSMILRNFSSHVGGIMYLQSPFFRTLLSLTFSLLTFLLFLFINLPYLIMVFWITRKLKNFIFFCILVETVLLNIHDSVVYNPFR